MSNLPAATKTMGIRLCTVVGVMFPAVWSSDFVVRVGIAAVGILIIWPVVTLMCNRQLIAQGRKELAADIYQRQVDQGYTID